MHVPSKSFYFQRRNLNVSNTYSINTFLNIQHCVVVLSLEVLLLQPGHYGPFCSSCFLFAQNISASAVQHEQVPVFLRGVTYSTFILFKVTISVDSCLDLSTDWCTVHVHQGDLILETSTKSGTERWSFYQDCLKTN